MENDKKAAQDTTKKNDHTDMPIKKAGTDYTDNTAGEPGLNQAEKIQNDLEPGTHERNPDSTETD